MWTAANAVGMHGIVFDSHTVEEILTGKYTGGQKKMKKVVKFGGSSLASSDQFKKVGQIIRSDESRRFVVPSAPGKRFSSDTKVTDMLIQLLWSRDS